MSERRISYLSRQALRPPSETTITATTKTRSCKEIRLSYVMREYTVELCNVGLYNRVTESENIHWNNHKISDIISDIADVLKKCNLYNMLIVYITIGIFPENKKGSR